MTPEEIRARQEEAKQLFNSWFESLPKEEAKAWLEAYQEDRAAMIKYLEEELAGCEALLWLARDCKPGDSPTAAVEAIRRKPDRTLEEAEALDAWDRIKNRPLSNYPSPSPSDRGFF